MNSTIDSLYSIRIGINHNLSITEVSKTLLAYMPQVKLGDHFNDHFRVHRPSSIVTFDDIDKHQGLLFLLVGQSDDFAVRGQIVDMSPLQSSDSKLVFLGSPWVGWLSTNRPDIELNISDFSAQDAQLDQIFLTVTEQQNVKDLKEIAEKLQIAKEEAEESNRIRSDFFAVMNHEMRTPLNGVITALNLFDTQQMNTHEKSLYGMAMDSAENLLVVINNVLDFSKLEAGKFEIEETSFGLQELLLSVRRVLIAKATDKGIDLSVQNLQGKDVQLLGDDSKIRQVLINLVSNAIKFTDAGSVAVGVESVGESNGKTIYRFAIVDTGHGVNPDIKDQIFQPFWTEVQGRAEIGTGLGLYICRMAVEMMGGDVQFDSTVGEGSTFWFDVPLAVSEEPPEITNLEVQPERDIAFSCSGRVLLVEDNPTNQALAKLLIKGYGPSVDVAGDGLEAIQLIQSYPYDLVLMDINMPNMGGIEATQTIRKDPQFDSLPIVALTAYSGASERDKYLSMGMNGYLKKPIESARLMRHLAKWLPPVDRNSGDSHGYSRRETDRRETDRREAGRRTEGLASESIEAHAVSTPQLDFAAFSKLFDELGEKAFDPIFFDFLKDFEEAVVRMEVSWAEKQLVHLAREAHSLCSCLRTYGAMKLGGRMEALDNRIKQNDIEGISSELEIALQECRKLPDILKDARAKIST